MLLAQLWQRPVTPAHASIVSNVNDTAIEALNASPSSSATSIEVSSPRVSPNRDVAQNELGEAMARGIRGEKK
jgi:hypothetical protein